MNREDFFATCVKIFLISSRLSIGEKSLVMTSWVSSERWTSFLLIQKWFFFFSRFETARRFRRKCVSRYRHRKIQNWVILLDSLPVRLECNLHFMENCTERSFTSLRDSPTSLLFLVQCNAKSKHWSILTFVPNVVVNVQIERIRFVDQQQQQKLCN